MDKQYHELVQGSPEWHIHRSHHFNASDAPAMLGVSKYKSRDKLLHDMTISETDEVSPTLQKVFDDGHKFEAMARPWAEEIIEEELFSPTISAEIDGMKLSSSFDGVTMFEDKIWEHKTLNESLARDIPNGYVGPMYAAQMEQQLIISGAEKCLFMASNGNKETMVHCWYESDPVLRAKILAGWAQFKKDLAAYEHQPEEVKPAATAIIELPSLLIEVHGGVKNSNLAVYESSALDFIRNINTDLKTDEDFANAEETVKFCGKAEKQLDLVKQQAIAQTTDIEMLFNTMDRLREELRTKRLSLEKLVTAQKATVKAEILNEASNALDLHIRDLNTELGGDYISYRADFHSAAKNKRTIASLRSAINGELANGKIAVDATAGKLRKNILTLKELAVDYKFLLHDFKDIIHKDNEDLVLLIKARIEDHKKAEAEKLEIHREQIRQEESAKLQAEADKKTENGAQANHEQVEKQQYRAPVNPSRTLGHPGPAEQPSRNAIERREDIPPTLYKDDAINAIREIGAPMSEKKAEAILKAIEKGQIPGVQAHYTTSKQAAA